MILALYGAGAMGREFRQIAEESGQWSGVVYIDDHAKAEELGGCQVYRFQVFRRQFTPDEVRFVVSIGEPKFRLEAFENMTRPDQPGCRNRGRHGGLRRCLYRFAGQSRKQLLHLEKCFRGP